MIRKDVKVGMTVSLKVQKASDPVTEWVVLAEKPVTLAGAPGGWDRTPVRLSDGSFAPERFRLADHSADVTTGVLVQHKRYLGTDEGMHCVHTRDLEPYEDALAAKQRLQEMAEERQRAAREHHRRNVDAIERYTRTRRHLSLEDLLPEPPAYPDAHRVQRLLVDLDRLCDALDQVAITAITATQR